MKKLIGFGSNYNLKELLLHCEDSSSEESNNHHHRYGTRYKNIFGYEDAAKDLFGYNDVKDMEAFINNLLNCLVQKIWSLRLARDLFSNNDVASEDARMTREIFGFEDADSESSHQEARTDIFGDDGEGVEISEAEAEEVDAEENVPLALTVDHLKIFMSL